jgi:hypothetical protein
LNVHGIDSLTEQVEGLRSLYLFSGGLMICLLAALLFRTRGGR